MPVTRSHRTAPQAISVHSSGHYMLDQYNNPFLMCGASEQVWTNISVANMQSVMQTRALQGFNCQLAYMIATQGGEGATGTPDWATFDGVVPFFQSDGVTLGTGPGNYDITKPNTPYWTRIDALFQAAQANGITLIVLLMDYTLLAAQGNTKLGTYATWFANRYASYVYHHLWSFDHFTTASGGWAAYDPYITVMLNAVKAVNPRCLHTIENNDGIWTVATPNLNLTSDDSSWTMGSGTSQMNLNWMYDARDNSPDTVRAYNLSPASPTFFGEGLYDTATSGKATWSNLLNRKYLYFPMVNGACGSFYGHGVAWFFGTGWASDLATTPVAHAGIWKAFMTSLQWWALVPDSAIAFVTTGNTYSAGVTGTNAAVTADGSLGLAYLPANASVTVAMTKMSHSGTVVARWFDPTNGAYTSIGSFANTGTHTFTSSGNNAGGDPDFVLVLTA